MHVAKSIRIVAAFLLLFPLKAFGLLGVVQNTTNTSCSASSATCVITVSSTGSNHGAIIWGASSSDFISSISDSSAWVVPAGCAKSGSSRHLSCAYTLSLASGETSITINWSNSSPGGSPYGQFLEISYTGNGLVFDSPGGGITETSCTSCPGVALTLTGNNDIVSQSIYLNASNYSSVSGGYGNQKTATNWASAYLLNTTSGAAPTWTWQATASGAGAAIALAEQPKGSTLRGAAKLAGKALLH
jgi:hypothetical protein